MTWKIDFYNNSVEDQILAMPPKIQARILKLLDLLEKHGANLGAPHTEPMGAQKPRRELDVCFIVI